MKKTTTKAKKTQVTTYRPVSKNIYFDGSSYRTRVTVDGELYSKSFPSQKQAVKYRNQLLPA